MSRSMHDIMPQSEYLASRAATAGWIRDVFKKSLTTGELTKMEGYRDNPLDPPSPSDGAGAVKFAREVKERRSAAVKMIGGMVAAIRGGQLTKAGVTTGLGFNFYDLRAPVMFLYPVNTPFRNSIPRIGRVNDGVGTAAHWKATRNPGIVYAGVSEGQRNQAATPDCIDYTASYKEIGIERLATFTAQSAADGLTNVLADEHQRGLHELFLQEEGLDLLGNSGTNTGNNGFALGTPPTPTQTVATTRTIGAAGNTAAGGSDLAYTAAFTTASFVSVAVVCLTAMGNPANTQYGYGFFPTVAAGLTPSAVRTNADGTTNTINGGISSISALGTPLQCTTGNLSVLAIIPLANRPIKGCFGYAWYVDVQASGISTLGGAKLAGITTTPYAYISGTPTGTQTGAASGLSTDHSFNTLDYDGLLTYVASTAGAVWTDLYGASLTSQKNGRVTEVETILQSIFTATQAGVDEIWGSVDAITALDAAVRWSGTSVTGYQIIVQRDQQSNIMGGFVVSGYQSRYAVASPTGSNVIPIRIHPMVPPGTLFFHIKTNPYPHSREGNVVEMLIQRDYYSIEWPLVSRNWTFGTYAHQVIRHNMPWISAVLTGIGPFVGS